jgi:ATP-binding protein involved in chromosome partitioning
LRRNNESALGKGDGQQAESQIEPNRKGALNMAEQMHTEETDRQIDPEKAQRKKRLVDHLAGIKHTLMVMSGKGGVGKSTVAANLALGLARSGYQVGLFDMDLHGPSIPRILGINARAMGLGKRELIAPVLYRPNLKVMSIESMMNDRDASIIWRGPMKIKAIKQFIADVEWGDLDFLIIDAPPGTGDEPLTIAQTIPGAQALIVTTPQELALADVRKAINFCGQLDMPILGLVENFSGQVCPQCGAYIEVFGKGGGQSTAKRYGLKFLGGIPWDSRIVSSEDAGQPMELDRDDSGAGPALHNLIEGVVGASKAETMEVQKAAEA